MTGSLSPRSRSCSLADKARAQRAPVDQRQHAGIGDADALVHRADGVVDGPNSTTSLAVPLEPGVSPEHRLYAQLEAEGPAAHSRYNALVRRLVSFERALACVSP